MSEWLEWLDIEEKPNYKGCRVYKLRVANLKGVPVGGLAVLQKTKMESSS